MAITSPTLRGPAATISSHAATAVRIGGPELLTEPGLREAWNGLMARVPGSTIFQRFEWQAACAETLPADQRAMLVLVVAEDGRVLAAAPFKRTERRGLGRRRVFEFLGFPTADYCDVLVDPAGDSAIEQAFAPFFEHRVDWDVLRLANVPEGSAVLRAVPEAFRARGYAVRVDVTAEAPTCLLDSVSIARIGRKKSLKRHHNALRRAGTLEIRHLTDASAIEPYLDAFVAQHVARWAATPSPSMFTSAATRAWLQTVVQRVAPTGHLLFTAVLFNGAPVACHLGFAADRRLIWYLPTYDPAYARHSPGEVLLKAVLDHAIERGFTEFDFGIGREKYKDRFAGGVRRIHRVEVFRTAALARTSQLVSGTVALVKRSDILRRVGRRARALTSGALW